MRKIMILGAGIYQVPLIKKARAMGLETIVVSVPGPYPGFAFADKTYSLDTRDVSGILAAAKEEKIDGIVAAIMALDRCIRHESDQGSVYDERGILFL